MPRTLPLRVNYALLAPAVISPRQPLRSHRSRSPEFYGFVAWTSTSLLFVVYVLWALLPDEYIRRLGIIWYPNREWAVLLPAYSVMSVLLTYFTYFSLALASTPAFSDPMAFIDSSYIWLLDAKAHIPALDGPDPYRRSRDPNAVPEPYDIPIGIVNRVLYSPGNRRE
ncbi:PIG-P [Pisolithus croceorrhizus]|nr:PIG-P [Pisolithus croceorrhizus]